MKDIQDIDLTTEEKNFISWIFIAIDTGFGMHGEPDTIMYYLNGFPEELRKLLDAELGFLKAKNSELTIAQTNLVLRQTGFRNYISHIKRQINIANEFRVLLNMVSRITYGKDDDYSGEVDKVRIQVEEALIELNKNLNARNDLIIKFKP